MLSSNFQTVLGVWGWIVQDLFVVVFLPLLLCSFKSAWKSRVEWSSMNLLEKGEE